MNRDSRGRPLKPRVMGLAWEVQDIRMLAESLITIANEEGPGHALQLLDHGYQTTSMTAETYDQIKLAILDSQVGKRRS